MSDAIKQRIQEDVKVAMRNNDGAKRDAIRMILAAVKQKEVDERIVIDDEKMLVILSNLLKQRRDSLQQYQQANRQDLAQKEQYEIDVIQSYLPTQLTETEINQLIEEAIKITGATSMKDMAQVMAHLKPKLQGRADMAVVSQTIKARLG